MYHRDLYWVNILLNIFLNNIFFFLKDANLGNYADDSTLYACNENLESVICSLRKELCILSNCFYVHYMLLNPGKCHFMLFGIKENEQFDLICNDITLKHRSQEKILGVAIDNKLSFDEHIVNICKTANKKLNALSRLNHYMKMKYYCHCSLSLISAIVPLFRCFAPKNQVKR